MEISTIEMEVAIMDYFDSRKNLIVPGITNTIGLVPFETDVLLITPSNCAYGFEIKISKADLKADFKKRHHTYRIEKGDDLCIEKYYRKFRHFYYVVPEFLKEIAVELIPEFCGLMCLHKSGNKLQEVKPAKILSKYNWSDKEKYQVARLGSMRIHTLKKNIIVLKNKNKSGIT